MNPFYSQPKLLVWIEALVLLAVGFLPGIYIIELAYDQPLYYGLFVVCIPVAQFALTPIFTLTGVYSYYSPMLIGYMANDREIDLHSGGSFDYLFVMRKHPPGIALRHRLLAYHLEGLLTLIEHVESGKIPSTVSIVGTSYFFSDSTLSRLGFALNKPTLFYRLNLFINGIDLIWMYSVARGQLSLPPLWRAKKARISGADLVAQKAVIANLHGRLLARVV